MRFVLPFLLAAAMCGACSDYRQVPCDAGGPHGTPPNVVFSPPDMAAPGQTPCDLGGKQDLSAPPADLALPPDNPECGCDMYGHGQGTGHCANHPGVWDGPGHGNGHCKYDCR